jgi:hypothetical protein
MQISSCLEGVNASPLFEACRSYLYACLELGLEARMLCIYTPYEFPSVKPPLDGWTTLGFDVAEPRGVHSRIWNDVIVTNASMHHWRARLNAHELFDDYEMAQRFISEWYTTKSDSTEMTESDQPDESDDQDWFRFVPVYLKMLDVQRDRQASPRP